MRSAYAHEQGIAEIDAQPCQRLAQRRLRQVEHPRRLGQAAFGQQHIKHLEVMQAEIVFMALRNSVHDVVSIWLASIPTSLRAGGGPSPEEQVAGDKADLRAVMRAAHGTVVHALEPAVELVVEAKQKAAGAVAAVIRLSP
ncbi:hypothetical protein ACTMU2_00455 [Cupriavidus basilensis]